MTDIDGGNENKAEGIKNIDNQHKPKNPAGKIKTEEKTSTNLKTYEKSRLPKAGDNTGVPVLGFIALIFAVIITSLKFKNKKQ